MRVNSNHTGIVANRDPFFDCKAVALCCARSKFAVVLPECAPLLKWVTIGQALLRPKNSAPGEVVMLKTVGRIDGFFRFGRSREVAESHKTRGLSGFPRLPGTAPEFKKTSNR